MFMRKIIIPRLFGFLLTFCFIFSFIIPLGFASENLSLEESVSQVVYFYKNTKTDLGNWEEVVALRAAGEDLSKSPWQLPDWELENINQSANACSYTGPILGIMASGGDPEDINDRNLVEELTEKQTEDGDFGGALHNTIWAIIALDTAQAQYDVSGAVEYLVNQQKSDGGFALSGNMGDPDMTGLTLIALSQHTDQEGVSEAINLAKQYIKDVQLDSGGFESWGQENAESIASVIRGLVACGENVTDDKWKKNDNTMIDALVAFQLGGKSFSHTLGGSSNGIATRQALIALADLVNGNVFYNIKKDELLGPAPVEEVTVRVRVEGATSSLADETVTVFGTALDALKLAVGSDNVTESDGFITEILGETGQKAVAENTDTRRMYYVIRDGDIDLEAFSQGSGSYNLQDGDEIIFYIGASDSQTYASKTFFPEVSISPDSPTSGQSLTMLISAKKYVWGSGLVDLTQEEKTAIGEYTVIVENEEYTSQNGQVTIPDIAEGTLAYTITNANDVGYADVVTYKGFIKVLNSGGGAGGSNSITVTIEVIGKDGESIFGPDTVTLEHSDPWGVTAMGALHATGLGYSEDDGFLEEIAGQVNSGMDGWMYKVNNTTPSVLAEDCPVSENNRITWWYSNDPDDMTGGSSLITTPEETPEFDDEDLFDTLEETGEARLNISNKPAIASLTLDAISRLDEENEPLIIENSNIELEFGTGSLVTDQIGELTDEENTSLEIQARELDETEKQEILTEAAIGESTELFDIGGEIFDLNAHIVQAEDDETASREEVKSFNNPVKVTIDLSDLDLSDEDIALLTAVRFEKDADGNITPVELGGTYDSDTKTFTFYTESFSYYGVCKAKERMIISLQIYKLNTTVDGDVKRLDVPPTIYNNRTVVPLRFVSECLGAGVEWIGETKTVKISLDDNQLSLVIGETIPGFDTPATIIDGRSSVPLRYVSESLGADVTWDAQSKKVEIVK